MPSFRTPGLLTLVVLAACGGKDAPAHDALSDTVASGSGPATTPGPALSAVPMLPGFRAHLDSVAAKPSMVRTAMAAHQAEVTALVGAMHSDMMAMGMHSDAAYEALADSVVQGSAALGTASGPDFERQVAAHVDQMRRLTASYETKTAAM